VNHFGTWPLFKLIAPSTNAHADSLHGLQYVHSRPISLLVSRNALISALRVLLDVSMDEQVRRHTAKTQYTRKLEINISIKEIARPQYRFPHSCACEQFIYSHGRSAFSCRKICGPFLGVYKSSPLCTLASPLCTLVQSAVYTGRGRFFSLY
jgi:hypothetical protein